MPTPEEWISAPRQDGVTADARNRRYLRRGQFPTDAESAYARWREANIVTLPGVTAEALEGFAKRIWLAGWRQRGEVAYEQPDYLEERRGRQP